MVYALLIFIPFGRVSAIHGEVDHSETIVLGIVQFPPLIVRDLVNYECHGSAINHSVALLEELGYDVHVECMPAARLFAMVEAGKVDVTINVSTTGALANKVSIVSPPYTYLSVVLLNHVDEKSAQTIAGIRGYDYTGLRQELTAKGYTFVDVPSSLDAINLFLHKRTSHLITYLRPYEYYIDSSIPALHVQKQQIKQRIPTYYAISRTSKRHDELLEKFNKFSKDRDFDVFSARFANNNNRKN